MPEIKAQDVWRFKNQNIPNLEGTNKMTTKAKWWAGCLTAFVLFVVIPGIILVVGVGVYVYTKNDTPATEMVDETAVKQANEKLDEVSEQFEALKFELAEKERLAEQTRIDKEKFEAEQAENARADERESALLEKLSAMEVKLEKVTSMQEVVPTAQSSALSKAEDWHPNIEARFKEAVNSIGGVTGIAEGKPDVSWVSAPDGILRIPLVRAPSNGAWSILTAQGTPVPDTQPEPGRSWTSLDESGLTSLMVSAPDGTQVHVGEAIAQKARVFGTVAQTSTGPTQ